LEFVNQAGRLRNPLIRRGGTLAEATWDEALDYVATRLGEYRGNGFALLTSPNSTNEEHYLAQKFARTVMQSNNVDQASNSQPELVLGLERSLGYSAATNSIWDLEHADCILVFNANLTEEHNVAAVPIKLAARKAAKLVVIDPREVELTRYAHLWLRPVPGTELLLLGGVMRSLLDQGLQRAEWLEENCESPADLYYALRALDMELVARVTNVSQDAMAEAARLFGQAGSGAIVYALDNIPAGLQRDCVRALVDLALVTGNVGKAGAGLYPMRRGANEQGAWDVGCLPDRLPGYRTVADAAARREVESAWGCELPAEPGLGAAAALEAALEGRVRAMLVIGDSPDLSNGKLGDGLAALQNLEFLVVQDTFFSPLTDRAHVVLPRATFAEKDGTFTNLERRIQRLKPAIQVKNSQARPEGWAISQLAGRMSALGFGHRSSAEVMGEIAQLTPIYSGVSYQRLEAEGRFVLRTSLESPQPTQVLYSGREQPGIQWPCVGPGAPSTPTLYAGGFPAAKAKLETPEFRAAESRADSEFPVWFVPGRVLLQAEREIEVVKARRNRIVRDELVELNPGDAGACAIGEDEEVAVYTKDHRVLGRARLVASVPPGVVAVTFLFGQLAADLEASEDMDPMSKVPGLDICPARVVKVGAGKT
jgi:predicted molibdopterin-dependent oxidoreductase YjgC